MENQVQPQSDTLKELAAIREQAKSQARGKGEEVDPNIPVKEEIEEPPKIEEKIAAVEPEELIRIGDKTFKTQSEAIKYAEGLEHQKEIAEAHTLGVQEALNATRIAAPEVPIEENFEEKFYSDPKSTLKELEERAVAKAEARIDAKVRAENLWKQFEDENPDLSGHRKIAEMVLRDNWETLGKMIDIPKAMKILATKTRSVFQDYNDKLKPRTELANRSGQVVSSGSESVTPPKKEQKVEEALDFVTQLKNSRRRA